MASNKIDTSWSLAQASWDSLRLNKQLIKLSLFGFGVIGLILALAAGIFFFNPNQLFYSNAQIVNEEITAFNLDFNPGALVLFVITFIIISLINSLIAGSIIKGTLSYFKGEKLSTKQILSQIKPKLVPLMAFGLVGLIVGQLIYYISSKFESLVASTAIQFLGNVAWSLATYFAIPIIVSEDSKVDPLNATKKSARLLKKVWGEGLISNVGLGLMIMVFVFAYVFVSASIIALIFAIGYTPLAIATVTILIAGLILMFIIFEALNLILKATLYYYATTNEAPAKFNKRILQNAFTPKQARKVFAE